MATKELKFDQEARNSMLKGVNEQGWSNRG
jgi:hypothetical protein